ncbi:MAG: hypothetical protein EBU08_21425, partial [Micrococcales bacterium]|nr:hypothetical protein [Micrococcales bacterium]
MNIFYLDRDHKTCAQQHCDKHVVKMIVEYAQLLSTAHRLIDGNQYYDKSKTNRKINRWKLNDYRETEYYHAVSWNHPSAVWVRQELSHYQWLWNLASELCQEYRHRYGGATDKQHKTSLVIQKLSFAPNNIPRNGLFLEPPQAMPEDVKVPGDSITAYRNYYRVHKKRFATWKNREVPNWYK